MIYVKYVSLPKKQFSFRPPILWLYMPTIYIYEWKYLDPGKFLTMSTEFDKNSSKWSYYSTDHRDYIKKNLKHFLPKLLDQQKSRFSDIILGIKLK